MTPIRVAIVGAGPAGLMAAEYLSAVDGLQISVFDAMPTVGRKFLMAGKGGLNLTHAEPFTDFLGRFGGREAQVAPWLAEFQPQDLRDWVHGLGIDTFVGTSGRVFPREMKAAPLLRAWLRRLRERGVEFCLKHRWQSGVAPSELRFRTSEGEVTPRFSACLFALGGGSWPQLGSTGEWLPYFQENGVAVHALEPANCGFDVAWSAHFLERFEGAAIKNVAATCDGAAVRGDFNITQRGLEGGLIYALSANLREAIKTREQARLTVDLLPARPLAEMIAALSRPRGRQSLSNHLRRQLGLDAAKLGLLRECSEIDAGTSAEVLARQIKAVPIAVIRPRPLAEAISSAGGVDFSAVDAGLMLKDHPGTFLAGEMLDWEAPTGGYLLTACLASGRHAAKSLVHWLGMNGTERANGQSSGKIIDPA